MEILFLLLVFFIVIPIVRIGAAVIRAHRNAKRYFDRFRQAAAGQAGFSSQEEPNGKRQAKKKKIDPSWGEYVAFEEISEIRVDKNASGDGTRRGRVVESQITDVEWEDVR